MVASDARQPTKGVEKSSLYNGPEPFSYQIPIRFTQTDPSGFVFFPRYFDMIHAASEEWFHNCLGVNFPEMIMVDRIGQPTAHTECQFIKPCFLGEKLKISVILEKFGNSSLHLRFVGTVNGENRISARSVQVLIDMDSRRPIQISEFMRAHLEAYQENVVALDAIFPERRP